MKKAVEVTVLSGGEIETILNGNELCGIQVIEEAFLKRLKGTVMLPDKISQIFEQETQKRINCMPASILDEKISGVKWVSVFPMNPEEGYANVTGQILLSELEHGYPIAFMDGTYLTAFRTAAVGAIASKYLGKDRCEDIGFIGAGQQARKHFRMMKLIHPEIKRCSVASPKNETVTSFITEMKESYSDVEFINCRFDCGRAVSDADIIVTATSTQADLLKADWIKRGALYIHVGGWEDEFAVPELADKIICDEWEAVKHRAQTLSRMYAAGRIKDSDIYCDLGEIIAGKKAGRVDDEEFIYFNSVGLGFVDVYLAYRVYQTACKLGMGVKVWL